MFTDKRNLVILVLAILNIILVAMLWFGPRPKEKVISLTDTAFSKKLEMDSKQTKEFKEVSLKFKTEVDELRERLYDTQFRMIQLISENPPDKVKASILGNSTGVIQVTLDQLLVDHYLDVESICTDSQKEKLGSVVMELMEKNGPQGLMPPK